MTPQQHDQPSSIGEQDRARLATLRQWFEDQMRLQPGGYAGYEMGVVVPGIVWGHIYALLADFDTRLRALEDAQQHDATPATDEQPTDESEGSAEEP